MIDFNDFNENISDEMLAAYIDGNATENEKSLIENSISDNSMLSEVVDIANDTTSFGSDFDWDLHDGDYGFWELGLPPVLNENDIMMDADIYDTSIGTECEDILWTDNLNPLDDDVASIETDDLLDIDDTDDLIDFDDIDDTLI